MADPSSGLFASDTDLQQYLADLLAGTRSGRASFGVPVGNTQIYGGTSEQRDRTPSPVDPLQLPSRTAYVGMQHPLGPAVAGLAASTSSQPGQPSIPGSSQTSFNPNVSLGMGPLSLSGGLNIGSGQVTPNFGAGLNLPVGQGNAQLGGNITPGQARSLYGRLNYPIDPNSDLALSADYTQPVTGKPDARFGLAYHRRF